MAKRKEKSLYTGIQEHNEKTEALERFLVYVVGPVSGVRDDLTYWTWLASRVKAALVRKGYVVVTPYDSWQCAEAWQEVPYEAWMAHGLQVVALCIEQGMVVAMPGWEASQGAACEIKAAMRQDIPCYEARLVDTVEGKEVELIPLEKVGDA